jgi:molecular chaperone GrpE
MVQGVRLVHRKFVTTMERRGVTSESAVGTLFDPQMHEALQQLADDSVPEGTVIREFQRAYKLHDRLLRPAMVVVATGGPSPTVAPAVAPAIEVAEAQAAQGEVIEVADESSDEAEG